MTTIQPKPIPTDTPKIYTVRFDCIQDDLRRVGIVACIVDASHRLGEAPGMVCAWHRDARDAERIAAALNRDIEAQRANWAAEMTAPPPEIADTGKVRLGDGFISAEFPPLPAKAK